MAKYIEGLGAMALELLGTELIIAERLEQSLDNILRLVQITAQSEFGTYQPGIGPFPAWVELADATKTDRVAQGYSENDPLYRSGNLRDSIEIEREGLEGVVGSKSMIMVYQEFGTEHIPPRPVLGPAALRNKSAIETLVAGAVVSGLIGKDVFGIGGAQAIHSSLGYDFRT